MKEKDITFKEIFYTVDSILNFLNQSGGTQMKYTQEVKDNAVKAAKDGMNLKEIQRTIGPNPKATLRYLVAAGIDYKKVKEELKAANKLQPATKSQGKSKKQNKVTKEEVIEE